jgi:hypothetical protein
MKILMVDLGGTGQRHVRNLRALMGTNVDIMAFRFRNQGHVLTEQLEIEEGSTIAEKYAINVLTEFVRLSNKNEMRFLFVTQAACTSQLLFGLQKQDATCLSKNRFHIIWKRLMN